MNSLKDLLRLVGVAIATLVLGACGSASQLSDGDPHSGSDGGILGPVDGGSDHSFPPDDGTNGYPDGAAVACANPNEAPLPSTQLGERTCVAVGASTVAASRGWPALEGARMPYVFVQSDAPPNGSGTMASPFNTLAEGVQALQGNPGFPGLGNGTVVLHSGDHNVAAPIVITHDLAVLGVGGPMGSLVQPPDVGRAVFQVGTEGISLTVTGVNFNKVTPHAGPIFVVTAGTLVVRNVDIEQSDIGIETVAGHLDAQDLTISGGTGHAISLGSTGDALIRSLLVRGSSVGIASNGAALDLALALVADASKAGVSVNAQSTTTARMDRVAVFGAGMVGIRLAGAGLTATATHLMVAGTHANVSWPGSGTGMLVTGTGVRFSLDPDIVSDAMQGLGSAFRENDRSGLVIADHADATIHGAFVGSNGQAGIVIQDSAVVDAVGYSFLTRNHGAGVMVSTHGQLAGLVCDGFVGNVRGTMHFSGAQDMEMADGASVDPGGTGMSILVSGCRFSGHGDFGLYCRGVITTLLNDTFDSNSHGWGVYGQSPPSLSGVTNSDPQQPPDPRMQAYGAMDTASAP